MKKTLLAIGVIVSLFSCKKDEHTSDFTATNMTGTVTVTGTLLQDFIDQLGNTYTVPASGKVVTVNIDNDQLYPNSNTAQGSRTYTATTDSNGVYTMTVTVGPDETTARWSVASYVTTRDSVDNATGNVIGTGDLVSFGGSAFNVTLYNGATHTQNYEFNATTINGSENTYLATLTGIITKYIIGQPANNSSLNNMFQTAPAAGVIVSIRVNNQTFTATTDANGNYSISFPAGSSGSDFVNIAVGATTGDITYTYEDMTDTTTTTNYAATTTSTFVDITNPNPVVSVLLNYLNSGAVTDWMANVGNQEDAGVAKVSGMLEIQHIDSAAGNPKVNIALANTTVYFSVSGSGGNAPQELTTTTDASGNYSFDVPVIGGSSLTGTLWVPDMNATQDTLDVNENVYKVGDAGVFNNESNFVSGMSKGEIIINEDMLYDNFTKD